ncbi:MAG: SMI1/KNR4 family protein [Chromatiales bacterium]|nr:SMI1/KNR4 family protein [Chromatiales bacterium]
MEPLFSRILTATRKRLFGSKPLFQPHKPATDITTIEAKVGASLPDSLRAWLATAGYGDIDEVLSFRSEWFNAIDRGELQGHVLFAQDDGGNFYSFSPTDGTIHFICRSAPEFAVMATDFEAFLAEFERRDFRLEEWTNSLKAKPYNWSA